jgi:hypothetical protein
MLRKPLPALLVAAALAVAGCGDAGHDHDHDHDAAPAATGHRHAAPRGGTLVEISHEAVNVEFLLDPATGTLTAWILDGCAEKPVRVVQETIPLQVVADGTAFRLDLAARASELTGETKGDTSEFAGQHDGLRGAATFRGLIERLDVAGRSYQGVKFQYAGSPK